MIAGWGVAQEVLPKQAPEAARETHGREDDIEKCEKELKKKGGEEEAELCWSDSALQAEAVWQVAARGKGKSCRTQFQKNINTLVQQVDRLYNIQQENQSEFFLSL